MLKDHNGILSDHCHRFDVVGEIVRRERRWASAAKRLWRVKGKGRRTLDYRSYANGLISKHRHQCVTPPAAADLRAGRRWR